MVRILKFKNLENLFKNFQNSGKHKITPIPIRVKFDKISKQQQDCKEVEARAARARAENPKSIHRDDKLDEKIFCMFSTLLSLQRLCPGYCKLSCISAS